MAKNYKDYEYFANRPDVVKVWEDIEAYHDWCRLELRPYDPAEIYRKDSPNYSAYLYSKRPRKPYLGKNPRFEKRSNGERFSR